MTDKQLVRYAMSFRKGILGKRPSAGQCGAICNPLASLLGMEGVDVTRVRVWLPEPYEMANHIFLRLPDGRVLDPTADQFPREHPGLPPVYLGPPLACHVSAADPSPLLACRPLRAAR